MYVYIYIYMSYMCLCLCLDRYNIYIYDIRYQISNVKLVHGVFCVPIGHKHSHRNVHFNFIQDPSEKWTMQQMHHESWFRSVCFHPFRVPAGSTPNAHVGFEHDSRSVGFITLSLVCGENTLSSSVLFGTHQSSSPYCKPHPAFRGGQMQRAETPGATKVDSSARVQQELHHLRMPFMRSCVQRACSCVLGGAKKHKPWG